jgi:hypothetical protein
MQVMNNSDGTIFTTSTIVFITGHIPDATLDTSIKVYSVESGQV